MEKRPKNLMDSPQQTRLEVLLQRWWQLCPWLVTELENPSASPREFAKVVADFLDVNAAVATEIARHTT